MQSVIQYTPTKHFLQRMRQRNVSVDKVMDILKNGEPRFLKHQKGIVELVKDQLKIILDTIKHKLVTIMHLNEKYAQLEELVDNLEETVLAQLKKEDIYSESEINPENKLKVEDETIIKKMIMPIPNP